MADRTRAENAEQIVVGIDLGTTHTVVAHAVVKDGVVVDDPIPQLTAPGEVAALPQLPSAIYLPASSELPEGALQLPWSSSSSLSSASSSPGFALGAFARAQGARVPGRLIVSAKS